MNHKVKTLFMFPGQGSQYSGMGQDWFQNFQEAREAFEEASDYSSLNLKKLCFEGSDADLKATEITQPAILTTTVAIWRSLKAHFDHLGSPDSVFAGHSLGEYSALVCAQYFDLGPVARVVRLRGKFMQEALPPGEGTMAALMFKPQTLNSLEWAQNLCAEVASRGEDFWIQVANENSPEQYVVSGTVKGVKALVELTQAPEKKSQIPLKRIVELAVSAPFHSKLMKSAQEKLKPEIEALKVSSKFAPTVSYIPNVNAELTPLDSESQIKNYLLDQITGSVRWVSTLKTAFNQAGVLNFLEVGPGAVLTGLAKRSGLELSVQEGIDRLEKFKKTPTEELRT